jgi:hypothetical protein
VLKAKERKGYPWLAPGGFSVVWVVEGWSALVVGGHTCVAYKTPGGAEGFAKILFVVKRNLLEKAK